MSIRVALFDDNRKFRDAISLFIGSVPELELAGVFADTADLANKLAQSEPDVVLMDIGIGPLDGIEATRWIIGRYPGIKVLMQTVFDEDSKVFAAICAGATGYVLKTAHLDTLLPYMKAARRCRRRSRAKRSVCSGIISVLEGNMRIIS